MRRFFFCLLLSMACVVVWPGVLLASAPVIEELHAITDHSALPDESDSYCHYVSLVIDDADGIGDISSVTVLDPAGYLHGGEFVLGEETTDFLPDGSHDIVRSSVLTDGRLLFEWFQDYMSDAPTIGQYVITATDAGAGSHQVTTPSTEAAPLSVTVVTYPLRDAAIPETAPEFSWEPYTADPGITEYQGSVWEVTDSGNVHVWGFSVPTDQFSVVYNYDGTATQLTLLPGHKYLLCLSAIRFVDWPEDPPAPPPVMSYAVQAGTQVEFYVYTESPVITGVWIEPGYYVDAPDWITYYDRVTVRATDGDGAADITSVVIAHPDGSVYELDPTTAWEWEQEGDYGIRCLWLTTSLASPPVPGQYSITVIDGSDNEDGLTTASVPSVAGTLPELTAPVMDSVIYDPSPIFQWTSPVVGAVGHVVLQEEGTVGDIWCGYAGEDTQVTYDGALQENHSYFWRLGYCCPPIDSGDPRVHISIINDVCGRFTMYGDWPETPPSLEGKFAYHSAMLPDWGLETVVGYSTDPNVRVWLGPEYSVHPDWSPDGSKLMYVGPSYPTIWLDPCDGSPPVAIPGVEGWFGSRWSPDGTTITYCYWAGPGWGQFWGQFEVEVANVDGSERHSVSHAASDIVTWPDWSPDGRWIGYQFSPDDVGQGLWLVRPDGTDAHPVIATEVIGYPGYGSISMGDPAWSPDASRLAVSFSAVEPGGDPNAWPEGCIRGIGTISPEGGPLTPVFVGPAAGGICCARPVLPQWSPDGTRIVFSSDHHLPDPGQWAEPGIELWMVNADGSGDPVRLTYNYSLDYYVSWWAANTHSGASQSVTIGNVTLTYEEVVAEGSTSIVVTDELPAPPPGDLTFVHDFTYHLSTTATISGTVTVAVDYTETAYPPVLGERLSLLLWDGAEWVDITTAIDTATYLITGQFAPGAESDWYVALALDRPGVPEVKVMFDACSEGRPSGPGLFVADADFSNPVRVTLPTPGTALEPECVCPCGTIASALSPDGSRVVMERTSAGTLEVMDLTALIQAPGQESVPLTDEYGDPVRGHMPNWSPSGDRIAYVGTIDLFEFDGIAVVNADGTDQHMIYSFPEPDYPPSARWVQWSSDGERILFQMGDAAHGGCHLYLLENLEDPGGATLRQLTTDDAYAEDQPHWSPDGRHVVFSRSIYGATTFRGGDIWVIDVETGVEHRLTDSPEIGKAAQGWCPYDGYVYFTDGYPPVVKRILPDGTGEEVVAADIAPVTVVVERLSWLPTGVWLDGLNLLPGESVTAKLGIADADNLAGVQAKVRYTGGSDTLTFDSILKAESILDWAMPGPSIGSDVASFLGYASDPETQALFGPNYLFDLNVTNNPTTQPGDLQLLTFDDLKLSDDWGDPIERISFDGGVHTIPFAYLEVSSITSPVCADADDPLPFTVMLTALDRDGLPMVDCDTTVEFGTFSWVWPYTSDPVTPTSVALVEGSWSGEVALMEPHTGHQLLAHWGDFGGYSNWFQAIGKGDTNADNRITVFDVIKVANMAIERGVWESWQWWAGDVNGDHEVNIFDVIEAANAAMEAMESMGIGRAGAPPVVAPPSEPVIVTTDVSTSDSQVVVAVKLSNCAGLAGVQVELDYDAKKLTYSGVSAGELLTGASSWSVMGNDLGGRVKAIAYTASAEVLSGGEGTILTFTFDQAGKGKAKVSVTAVELADVEGGEIPSQTSGGKGRGKGKNK